MANIIINAVASGYYKYADKNPVKYVMSPNEIYGLCAVYNFNLPDMIINKLRFTPIADNRAAIFAITIENR